MSQKNKALIVFCGMDGTGKTTLAQGLVEFLKSCNIKCFFKHGHTYLTSGNSFGASEKAVRKYRLLLSLLIPFAWLDSWMTYIFKYRPKKTKGIFVCDRYFYDKIARLVFYEICSKKIAAMYIKSLPHPDHVFFLSVSPQIAHDRKKEYSVEQCKAFQEIYQFLGLCVNATFINTEESKETCHKKILESLKDVL